MQQPEEPAPEPEAEGPGRFRLVGEAGVVEPELLQGVAQIGQFVAVDGEQSAEHHRLGVPVSGQSGRRRTTGGGHRLTGAGPTHVLDSRDQVTHLTGPELVHRFGHRGADPDLFDLVVARRLHEPQPVGCRQRALHHPDGADHAAVLVVGGVEDQGLQRSAGIAGRGRDPLDDGVQQLGHPLSGLGRDVQDRRRLDAEDLFDLCGAPGRVGRRQIDLVEDGHDLELVLEGLIAVGQGLGLNALGGVDQQHRPFARGQRPADLVAEVHVTGGVDQMEGVVAPAHPDVLGLDGDPPLPFDVHRVEVLFAHQAGSTAPVSSRIRSDRVDLP